MSNSLEAFAESIRQHPKLVIADDFEIALQRSLGEGVRYQNGSVRSSSKTEHLWISLRILHRKRGGKAALLNPTLASIGALVDAAFESANQSSVDPWFRFSKWKAMTPSPAGVTAFDPSSLMARVPAECIHFEEGYELRQVETFLKRKTEKFHLHHSAATSFAQHSLLFEFPGELVHFQEEHGLVGLAGEARLTQTIEKALARKSRSPKPCGRGRRKVVLGPQVVAGFLQALGPWFHADAVQNGRSPFFAAPADSFFGPAIHIVDDPNAPEQGASMPFDLEGAPTQRTVLVDKGQIKSYLYDVYSATRDNRLSTGNFFRLGSAPFPRILPSNLYIEPGTASPQSLLETMGNGIFIDSMDSLEPLPGKTRRLRLKASGWRVAFGQASEPLSGIEGEVDLLSLFRSASAVAKDLTFFSGCGSPSILFEEMPLGS